MIFDLSTLVTLATALSVANALIPITIKGNRFIQPATKATDDGEVFFIKGVDYQPGGSSAYTGDESDGDVLSDADTCYRDAYVLQAAGVNTIRTYTVNPDVNHDKCMSILNDAGIYVLLDVNSALNNEALNRYKPSTTYNADYLTRVFKVIDAFKNYPNLLGFFAGNEIINDDTSAKASPPYVRAVIRDMKQYIEKHADRAIPVGYSAADLSDYRLATFDYLTCDNDGDYSRSDFFGLNSYAWCNGDSFTTSGYDKFNSTFSNSSVPVFFSEFGCNTETPRTFEEVSKGMFDGLLETFSGGLVYEYAEEENQYGLIEVDDDTLTFKDDYANFKSQLSKVNTTDLFKESDVSNRSYASCSSSVISKDDSKFNSTFTLPSQPSDIAKLISNGVSSDNVGKIVDVDAQESNSTIVDNKGSTLSDPTVTFDAANEVNSQDGTTPAVSTATSTDSSSSSGSSSASATATKNDTSSSSKGDAAVMVGTSPVGYVSAIIALGLSMLI